MSTRQSAVMQEMKISKIVAINSNKKSLVLLDVMILLYMCVSVICCNIKEVREP